MHQLMLAVSICAFCNGRKGCAENSIGDRWNGRFGDLCDGEMSLLGPPVTHSAPVKQSFEISISAEKLFRRHN